MALRCARAQRRRPPAQADVAELPSGGDNSYPGFIALDGTRGLLSYYSSHEGSASIYLAELRLS
ncbi:MAG TPA: hypothetical protein EYM39_04085 [Candidatus Latescibacteria bacterium]|nr:hypothetical protein [Candidatus Latescibacterota bacterium]